MRVTVKYVNHPSKPDGKYGNIKTTDDQMIMVPVANMGFFQRGMTCDIATEQRTWGSGAEARPVTIAVGAPGSGSGGLAMGGQQIAQGYGGGQTQGYTAPPGPAAQTGNIVQLTPQPAPESLPRPYRGNPDARSIFATACVGRALGSGKFAASEIDVLLGEALRQWDKHLGEG